MGLYAIILLDAVALLAAVILHRRYPQGAYEDVGLLVASGALLLAMTPLAMAPRVPGLVISALGWSVLAVKAMRFRARVGEGNAVP